MATNPAKGKIGSPKAYGKTGIVIKGSHMPVGSKPNHSPSSNIGSIKNPPLGANFTR